MNARRKRGKATPAAVARARRIEQAIELRILGHGYAEIAAMVGVSVGCAHGYVLRGLAQIAERADQKARFLKLIELERLDRLVRSVFATAIDGTIPANDRRPAFDVIMQAMDRRAKLLGLYAPKNVDTSVGVPPIVIQSSSAEV